MVGVDSFTINLPIVDVPKNDLVVVAIAGGKKTSIEPRCRRLSGEASPPTIGCAERCLDVGTDV